MKGKDYTQRALVKNYLPWWRNFVKEHGLEYALKVLKAGKTKYLTRKDELGLIQALTEEHNA